jgi:hypothetical protein
MTFFRLGKLGLASQASLYGGDENRKPKEWAAFRTMSSGRVCFCRTPFIILRRAGETLENCDSAIADFYSVLPTPLVNGCRVTHTPDRTAGNQSEEREA